MGKSFEKTVSAVAQDAEQRSGSAGAGGLGNAFVGVAPALVAGESSAPISANITSGSKFFFSLNVASGATALGVPQAVNITPGQPGSFKIISNTPASPGVALAADTGTYNYIITQD
jgi:hypothetical protein